MQIESNLPAVSGVVRWGILGTAGIARNQVIPAMQRGRHTTVVAIASRDRGRAQTVAHDLGIGAAHGSYEALLADANVDAVYIPLPNHLHVPWSIRALDAGKHVLCEKPIGLSAAETGTLVAAAAGHPRLNVMEAFMYRVHPQWQRVRQLVAAGAIGEVTAVHTLFSYFNDDPQNIRNRLDAGGGALMDIGCYGISAARFVFGREPRCVTSMSNRDDRFGTDSLTAAIMDFGQATATFTCATQLMRHQRVDIMGASGRIEIEIPFNPPSDRASRIRLHRGQEVQEITFEPCNQYTIQGDLFSRAILDGTDVPTPIADAVANMQALDAVRLSAGSGAVVAIRPC
jgi:predicted dehydrogenase